MFVENKATCILTPLPGAQLLPGITFVEDGVWDQCAEKRFAKHYLDEGLLVPIEATRGKSDLKALEVSQAIKIVRQVTDRKLLQQLKRKEQRNDVIDEIDVRLSKLDPTVKED